MRLPVNISAAIVDANNRAVEYANGFVGRDVMAHISDKRAKGFRKARIISAAVIEMQVMVKVRIYNKKKEGFIKQKLDCEERFHPLSSYALEGK